MVVVAVGVMKKEQSLENDIKYIRSADNYDDRDNDDCDEEEEFAERRQKLLLLPLMVKTTLENDRRAISSDGDNGDD